MKQKCQTVTGTSFSNGQICCYSWYNVMVNKKSLSFRLLVRQNQQLEDFLWAL